MNNSQRESGRTAGRGSRRGSSQHFERDRDTATGNRRQSNSFNPNMSMAKPAVSNGKKAYYYRSNSNSSSTSEQCESSHEENVRYVSDAWQRVQSDYESSKRNNRAGPELYQEKSPIDLPNFEPYNLELLLSRTQMRMHSQS